MRRAKPKVTNGGLAIKNTFNRFTELYFGRQPGCNSLEIN